jgi:CubicO group peptidase (beta-lactamase class C family)
LVKTNNFTGSIAVANLDDLLFKKSYGKMNIEYNLDNHSKSRFFLASASMMFTSAAIMKLVDEGKLSLEDPMSRYIPDYPHGSKITIHHMLSQRSGIPRIGRNGKVVYNEITYFPHSTQKLLDYVWDDDLLFVPGERYMHERTDYIFLASIIEKISGLSYGEYLKEKIFLPLGMENSGHYSSQTEIVANLCKGYAPKELYDLESAPFLDWSSKTGHASIYSTAEDLIKWGRAVLNKELLSDSSWDKILTNHGDNVGYGWFISPHNGHRRFQMNGRSPGFSSYISIYPDDDLIVSMLSNIYVSLPRVIGPEIASIYFDEEYNSLELSDKELTDEEAASIIGRYQFGPDFYRPNGVVRIFHNDGGIYGDWGGLIPIEEGTGKYRKFIYRNFWSDIEFKENDDGVVTEMKFDEYIGTKI